MGSLSFLPTESCSSEFSGRLGMSGGQLGLLTYLFFTFSSHPLKHIKMVTILVLNQHLVAIFKMWEPQPLGSPGSIHWHQRESYLHHRPSAPTPASVSVACPSCPISTRTIRHRISIQRALLKPGHLQLDLGDGQRVT